jgi:beta-lactamase regulating signal transducer with metallopeptidase domain
MSNWWLVAQHVATTAVLVAVVTLACRMIPNRPALQHALWVVVLVKFVMPPTIEWPLTASDLLERAAPNWLSQSAPEQTLKTRGDALDPALPNSIELVARNIPASAAADLRTANDETALLPLTAVEPMHDRVVSSTPRDWLQIVERWSLGLLLATAWVCGSLAVLARRLQQIRNYRRLVGRATAAPAPLATEAARLARRIRVRPIPIVVSSEVSSPFVWCFGRLKVIWPGDYGDQASPVQWRGILAHELAHVRRRDHWVAWLEMFAGIVWWWNPAFWFARRRLHDAAEIACDALALSLLPDGRRAYAEALLELSATRYESVPVLGAGSRDRKSFERRLTMILSRRVIGGVSWPGLLAIATLCVVALPAWSLGQADPPEAPKPAPTSDDVSIVKEEPGEERPKKPADPYKAPTPDDPTTFRMKERTTDDPTTIRMPAGSKCEISRSTNTFERATTEDPAIVRIYTLSDHLVRLEAKKVGIARLHFYDENDKLEVIRVEVVEASPEPATVVLDPSPEAITAKPEQPETRKPAARQYLVDPRVAIDFPGVSGSGSGPYRPLDAAPVIAATSGRYNDQINITDLGIAIIEARGEAKLAETQMAAYASANANARGTVSRGETLAAEIKRETAKEKLALLMRFGQSAYDSAQSDLQVQQAAVERLTQLKDARKISTAQFEQGEAQLRAAQAKVNLIEIAVPDLKKNR